MAQSGGGLGCGYADGEGRQVRPGARFHSRPASAVIFPESREGLSSHCPPLLPPRVSDLPTLRTNRAHHMQKQLESAPLVKM
jgi:hypothetical protein